MFKYRWLSLLFCLSLLLCLSLPHRFLTSNPIAFGQAVRAQTTDTSLQQGLKHYQSGNFQDAIQIWTQALSHHPNSEKQLALLKHLARAYSQLGQYDRSIASFNALITQYQKTGDRLQLGRMRTEQAQAYSNLGQHRKAIALLCGETTEQTCAKDSAIAIRPSAV